MGKSLSTDLEEFLKVANEKYDDQALENSDTDTNSFDPKSKVSKLPPQSENSDSDAPEIPTEDFIEVSLEDQSYVIDGLESKVAELKIKLERESVTNKRIMIENEKLDSVLNELQQERELRKLAEEENDTLNHENEQKDVKIQNFKRQIEELREDLATFEEEREFSENKNRNEIENLRSKIEGLKEKETQSTDENEKLMLKVYDLESKTQNFEQEIQNQELIRSDLESRLREKNEELDDLKLKDNDFDAKTQNLEDENENYKAKIEGLEDELSNLQIQFANLQTGQNSEVENFAKRNGVLTADV